LYRDLGQQYFRYDGDVQEQVDAFRQAFGALGEFFGITEGLIVRAVANAIEPADAANLDVQTNKGAPMGS
jgi:hypothetical protein